jgi:myo-inositol catabolism protein IolC
MDAMITGYEKPLYILPFDHRHSYITGVFHWHEPLTPSQVAKIVAGKQVIYDGFTTAVAGHAMRDRAGILVDEGFGAALLQDAAARGYITCVSTEKSGQDEFDFEYGDDFARHIEAVGRTRTPWCGGSQSQQTSLASLVLPSAGRRGWMP